MNLFTWANKWGISHDAINDLRFEMGQCDVPQSDPTLQSEAGVQTRERLKSARAGGLMWRNNVGAMQEDSGRVVRYGLANESKKMNQQFKSSDLIGITPMTIGGQTVGIFTAVECKEPNWKYTGTDHEVAQARFHSLVLSRGGIAYFTNGS